MTGAQMPRTGIALFRWDPAADVLRLSASNPGADALLGRQLGADVGQSLHEVLPRLAPDALTRLRSIAAQGGSLELSSVHHDDGESSGTLQVTAFCPTPGELTFVVSDAGDQLQSARTDLAASRAALEHQRRVLDEALSLSRTGAWEWNVVEDQWWFSHHWHELHGTDGRPLSSEELMGIAHEDDADRVAMAFAAAVAGERDYDIEHRIRRVDTSEVRSVRARAVPVEGPDGHVERLFGFAQDVTDRVAALEEAAASNRELEKFAYVVSHDLKAPLRGIRLASQWLADDVDATSLSADARENLYFIGSRVRRLSSMIDAILDYSRIQRRALEERPFELGEVVRAVVEDISASCTHTFVVADDWPTLHGDSMMVQRVVQNLVDNAAKYHDQPPGTIEIGWRSEAPMCRVFVRDDGPGIPAELRERVFEMFATLHRRDEIDTTGVGLSLCESLVKRWGGTIEVQPAQPRGCEFSFTLPA